MRSLWKHVGNGISASCSGTRGGMGDERGSGELASGERAGSGFGGAPEQELGDAQRGSDASLPHGFDEATVVARAHRPQTDKV